MNSAHFWVLLSMIAGFAFRFGPGIVFSLETLSVFVWRTSALAGCFALGLPESAERIQTSSWHSHVQSYTFASRSVRPLAPCLVPPPSHFPFSFLNLLIKSSAASSRLSSFLCFISVCPSALTFSFRHGEKTPVDQVNESVI